MHGRSPKLVNMFCGLGEGVSQCPSGSFVGVDLDCRLTRERFEIPPEELERVAAERETFFRTCGLY